LPRATYGVWRVESARDRFKHGRRLDWLTIVDDHSEDAIGVEGKRVTRVLDRAGWFRRVTLRLV
jgi:hypothetical protein